MGIQPWEPPPHFTILSSACTAWASPCDTAGYHTALNNNV